MQTYNELLDKVLLLNEKERALMAEKLVRSLDPAVDTNTEKEWQAEIEKRIREIDSKEVGLLDWKTVRDNLRRE